MLVSYYRFWFRAKPRLICYFMKLCPDFARCDWNRLVAILITVVRTSNAHEPRIQELSTLLKYNLAPVRRARLKIRYSNLIHFNLYFGSSFTIIQIFGSILTSTQYPFITDCLTNPSKLFQPSAILSVQRLGRGIVRSSP